MGNVERTPTDAEWEQARVKGKSKKTFASHECVFCGRTIREGAWGSRTSNLTKHLDACTSNPENQEGR